MLYYNSLTHLLNVLDVSRPLPQSFLPESSGSLMTLSVSTRNALRDILHEKVSHFGASHSEDFSSETEEGDKDNNNVKKQMLESRDNLFPNLTSSIDAKIRPSNNHIHNRNTSDADESDHEHEDVDSDGSSGNHLTRKPSAYMESPNSVSCPYCGRSFPWTSSLRRHLLTHTGAKPYKCPCCPILFTTKSNCERHLIRKHKYDHKTISEVELVEMPTESPPIKS